MPVVFHTGAGAPFALSSLLIVPPHRVMAGSDLPESPVVELGKIVDAQLSPEAKRAVLWDTPRRVFDQVG